VVTVHLPPLRERRSDIPTLVHWFLDRRGGPDVQVSSAAMKCMLEYDWPGNVRELENCIERALALGSDKILNIDDLPEALLTSSAPENGAAAFSGELSSGDLEDLEKAAIERVFYQVNGDKVRAGKILGISRATLYRKLKRYNIGAQLSSSGLSMR
jgi:transcriptional regulator with PAS, ATPase and Fis domain